MRGRLWNEVPSMRFMGRVAVAVVLAVAGLRYVPSWWCGREAAGWYRGESADQVPLADGVSQWVTSDLSRADYSTGSSLFDGEWLFGTYLMAGLGLCQVAAEHPDLADRYRGAIDHCLDGILSDKVRAFDAERWRSDPLEDLDGPNHHAAYLGYMNLLLGVHRSLDPGSRFAEMNDRITESLVRRIDASPTGLLMTYPQETYPVDNVAVIASIGLHNRVTDAGRNAWLAAWRETFGDRCIDEASGLLIQAVDENGDAIDKPRGSGTSLSVYFLSFVDPAWSRRLYEAMREELAGHWVGFGAVREYRRGVVGFGDIDSGPVLFGWSFSATGFAIAGSRIHGDRQLYGRLFASAWLAGAPLDRGGVRTYVTGGPLGTCILLAMLTAPTDGWRVEEADDA